MPSGDDPADAFDCKSSFTATFDPADERPSEVVVSAVASVAGVSPLELGPLYAVVDPGALDALVAHAQRTGTGTHRVWFAYEGFDVCVRTNGEVRILDPADAGPTA